MVMFRNCVFYKYFLRRLNNIIINIRKMIFIANQHNPTISRHRWHDFHSPPFTVFQFFPQPTVIATQPWILIGWILVREQFAIKCFAMCSIAVNINYQIKSSPFWIAILNFIIRAILIFSSKYILCTKIIWSLIA